MAGNVSVSIKDNDSAVAWLNKVTQINEDYHKAMKDAGDALVSVQDFAEGTIVDDLVKVGNDMLVAAEQTFNAIDAIADTVNNILSKVKDFTGEVLGLFGNAAKMFLGN